MARTSRIGANLAGPVTLVSWPALCRPSTSLPRSAPPVVDGRAKPGHDTIGMATLCVPLCWRLCEQARARPAACEVDHHDDGEISFECRMECYRSASHTTCGVRGLWIRS